MAKFKCKKCGSDMYVNDNMTIEICERCGATMTLPKNKSEKKADLYNTANQFRVNGEFEKAMEIYSGMLNEDPNDAEAHWNMVLCKYGVLYVEDKSRKRVTTCTRMGTAAVTDDSDYQQALSNADVLAKGVYEDEAKKIAELQKELMNIANSQPPYDVYISYQETDSNGRRTADSLLAHDIYNELTDEGYRVFYSRVTLEDKLSDEYEPYIYSALNSSKVMIALATKPEFFNGSVMSGEWGRFVNMIKAGANKLIIPAYKDMMEDELPNALSGYKSLDMGNMKFLIDLLKSVGGMCAPSQQAAPAPQPAPAPRTVPQAAPAPQPVPTPRPAPAPQPVSDSQEIPPIRRAFTALRNSEWDEAEEILDRILASEPNNAKAYIGKLMIDLRIKNESDLGTQNKAFNTNEYFRSALQYADEKYREKLEKYVNEVATTLKANGLKYLKMIRENKKQKAEIDAEIKKLTEEANSLGKLQFSKKNKLLAQVEDLKKQLGELNIDLTMNGKIGALSPGYLINFGHYNNKKIVWRVLKVEPERVMFIAEDCIDSKMYNDTARDCFWQLSPLRKWLNTDFMNNAFNLDEKNTILMSHIVNPNNPQYDITGGNDTDDFLFLLSLDEASELFETNDDRIALGISGGRVKWWLRSPGINNKFASCIDEDGNINIKGDTNATEDGVRPVVWTTMDIMKIINN